MTSHCNFIPTEEDMGGRVLRGRMSSTCSEEGTETTQEADYDGDGEDSIYYSSTENLHRAVSEQGWVGGERQLSAALPHTYIPLPLINRSLRERMVHETE